MPVTDVPVRIFWKGGCVPMSACAPRPWASAMTSASRQFVGCVAPRDERLGVTGRPAWLRRGPHLPRGTSKPQQDFPIRLESASSDARTDAELERGDVRLGPATGLPGEVAPFSRTPYRDGRKSPLLELRPHWRDHGVSQIEAETAAGRQESDEGSDGAGNVGCRGARVAAGTPNKGCVDVGQAHLALGLARGSQVIEQLAMRSTFLWAVTLGCPSVG